MVNITTIYQIVINSIWNDIPLIKFDAVCLERLEPIDLVGT